MDFLTNNKKMNMPEIDEYACFIMQAIESLEHHCYPEAEQFIIHAIAINYNLPQAHNLLGALNEYKGDTLQANKHYCAANALDPTYLPAIRNLRRLTTFYFREKPAKPDMGLNPNRT